MLGELPKRKSGGNDTFFFNYICSPIYSIMIRYLLLFVLLLLSLQIIAQTGIGTTTPVNKFQIETASAAPLTTGIGFNGNLRLGATGANQVLDFGLGTTYGWIQSRDKTTYGTNYILALNPNGGNVGINKIAPTKALDVTGDVGVSGNLTGSSTSKLSGFGAQINTITSSYELTASDNAEVIQSNANLAISLTIPTNLPTGFNCMILQYGTGQITFTAASGVTLINRNSYNKTIGQYALVTVLHIGSNIVVISGELSN